MQYAGWRAAKGMGKKDASGMPPIANYVSVPTYVYYYMSVFVWIGSGSQPRKHITTAQGKKAKQRKRKE